jgi:hypothetical protein
MKNDWWFKFQYSKWDDPELKECTLETQGFWLRVYIHLRKKGQSSISGTVEDLAKIAGAKVSETTRSILDLHKNDAADVTLRNARVTLKNVTCNSHVTLTSRSLAKELSGKEKTKLRVRKCRDKKNVTPAVTVQSKSNKKEVREESNDNVVQAAVAEPQKPPTQQPPGKQLPIEIFLGTAMAGITVRMNLRSLPDKFDWEKHLRWAFANNFTSEDVLECYDLLRQQDWRDGPITGKTIAKNLPHLDELRSPIAKIQNNGKHNKPTSEREKSAQRSSNTRSAAQRLIDEGLAERSEQGLPGDSDADRLESDQPRQLPGSH